MKFKIVCYHTVFHIRMKVYKTRDFKEALQIFNEECTKEEAFIDVQLYKGLIKITSCFMGNDYYKELKESLNKISFSLHTTRQNKLCDRIK